MFFTGERGVGKSTLLNRLLAKRQLKIDGFRTLPFVHPGGGKGFIWLPMKKFPWPIPDRTESSPGVQPTAESKSVFHMCLIQWE